MLLAAAERQFGTLADLTARLAVHPNPPRMIAQFAPAVVQAARDGDAIAQTVVSDASAALARTVRMAAARLPGERWLFATAGGLATMGDILAGPLRKQLQGSKLNPVAVLGTALDGARLLSTPAVAFYGAAVIREAAGTGQDHALDRLATEAVRPGFGDLDERGAGAVVLLALEAEHAALLLAAPALAVLAEAVAARMRAGGRLFYLGAGTPGCLATLDAAELSPTHSLPPGR